MVTKMVPVGSVGGVLVSLLLILRVNICSARFLLLVDDNQPNWSSTFANGLKDYEEGKGKNYDFVSVVYKNDSSWEAVCQAAAGGISAVLDVTHSKDPETQPQTFFTSKNVPYFKIDVPTDNLIVGAKEMLESKGASNGFLIFHSENDVSRGIHDILGHTLIRFAFLDAVTMSPLIVEKFEYRIPSAVVLFGTPAQFEEFIRTKYKVVRDLTEWVFMYNGFQKAPKNLNVTFPYLRGFFDGALCCKLQPGAGGSTGAGAASGATATGCDPAQCLGDPSEMYLRKLAYIFSGVWAETDPNGSKLVKLGCDAGNKAAGDAGFKSSFTTKLGEKSEGLFTVKDSKLGFVSCLKFEQHFNGSSTPVGTFESSTGFSKDAAYFFRSRPKYYRIGIVDFPPWTYKDEETGEWTGYCIELAKGIADKMNFTFDLVVSDGFGHRDKETMRWDGLTGDLIHGKIDIAVAAYIMTSEREEFIDFVSPYYEQSGLIITMKKPVVKNSLFKFMTVLRAEVWFSIAGATIATGFMLWFLDKFSPYSAQNNPHKYKSFRKFTLKESFWFALTSFTPQGGGEPPKAFSGRTLVAAYWIFVVLMLATFTANLAAFLTVERMQSPIRNLEHLAGQSSVKYSVVNGSTAQRFFNNMAHAEETLYQMWRNLTLSAPSSAKEYIVWEYPIREMYIHINSVIQKTGEVEEPQKGFDRVLQDEYYAFIHDAAQTRYEVYRNCSLTLIGEPFAESPYAIAVAQGNPLQDDISMAILELQTNRFFESLSSKYWNSKCQSMSEGESDGISLESLGGVFIATIIGLGIAFISLAIEVFTTTRNRRKAKIEADKIANKTQFLGPMDFYNYNNGSKIKKAEAIKRGHFMPEVIN